MNSEVTAPPEMERYDFGQFTMEIPEDSDVELIGSDLSLSGVKKKPSSLFFKKNIYTF